MRFDEATLPHNAVAEQALLACLLLDPSKLFDCGALGSDGEAAAAFYDCRNRLVFETISKLKNAGGTVDVMTVTAALGEAGKLKEAGGADYVTKLLDASPTAHVAAQHAATVVRFAQRRRVLDVVERLHAAAFESADIGPVLATAQLQLADVAAATGGTGALRAVEFLRPSELRDYRPPEGIVLAGDCHIVRGNVFVIGGPPGVGKSRGGVALGVAGATGAEWFGLKIHFRFRTMIIQNENGRFRLSREFADLNCAALDDFVRVCPPPPLGLAFDRVEFRAALAAAIADFRPDVIVIDPWNAVARDEKARDYLETFNAIRAVIPTGDTAPALGIVAHTRKPRTDERATGRGLLNLLAGSYVLGSVPRTVFVMQSASDEPTENRVVWTCCKNNDGELGERSAWERRNGLFAPVADFNWTEFDRPASERPTVTEADVAEVFQHGKRSLRKAEAVAELQERTGAGKSACYNALRLDGRFARHLKESEGSLTWTP